MARDQWIPLGYILCLAVPVSWGRVALRLSSFLLLPRLFGYSPVMSSADEKTKNSGPDGIHPVEPQPQLESQKEPLPAAVDENKNGNVEAFEATQSHSSENDGETVKRRWWHSIKEPGSALQIVSAAILAIAIGLAVVTTTDEVPQPAIDIIGIPGSLWLRGLKCVVLPLIITALIISMQRMKALAGDSMLLAYWTVGYYMITTLLAIVISTILTSLVWAPRFREVDDSQLELSEAEQADIDKRPTYTISESVVNLFESFVSDNIVGSLANTELLAVVVASIIIGLLLKSGSSIVKVCHEVDAIVTVIITFLIKVAPIGVFSLILSNLFTLDLATMAESLGFLIAGALTNFFIHLFVVIPIIFFVFTRMNPFTYWLACSPAWITAWGSASSAGTLPVTIRVVRERGVPEVINKFAVPLGCMINMDGTAIYFPVAVTFMARTQGMDITPVQYIIVVCLSTLASIGATPIPSSSLVLIIMICESINVPLTGMFAVITAIDWFLDRFRTALNVSGDCMAAKVIEKQTKITDASVADSEMEKMC
ncbi:Excitatory amino acid transporter [Paramyrothecium foliicola]|nr:Excitatory amino acid transporter [Paramyrothecium foliicola]